MSTDEAEPRMIAHLVHHIVSSGRVKYDGKFITAPLVEGNGRYFSFYTL